MATDAAFVDYIIDQMSAAGRMASRKMFGEYAIYCDEKVVALVCDNQLFVKPTEKGRALIGDVVEAPPYPGAKPYFLVEDGCDDRAWICELIRITTQEIPLAKRRPSKTRRSTRPNGRDGRAPGHAPRSGPLPPASRQDTPPDGRLIGTRQRQHG